MDSAANSLTIPALLAITVARREDEPALGCIRDGSLRWHTWRNIWDAANHLVAALRAAGIKPGDRVAHISENRYEWIITDLALHLAGAVHVPIHVTLSGSQIAEQIADSGARLVFVSSAELASKFAQQIDKSILLRIHDAPPPKADEPRLADAPTHTADPHDLATILYTSGTTGRPRGVMLSQKNLAWNASETVNAHGGSSGQTRINILPFSHIYARTCDLYTWVYSGSRLVLAESRETLIRDCKLAQPTVLNGVPHLYKLIDEWARAPVLLPALLGGRMKQLICGGAAIASDIENFFAEQGLPLLPGYGLTEASPVISISTPGARKVGSVGRPLAGLDVRIADDGELLVRGPNVMLGYWQDESATAEAIHDGWLHTGDLGELDTDGFLSIRGRKKELIVLSTGKKVSPTRVEALLTASPFIEQAAVFGEGLPGLFALVKPAWHGEPATFISSFRDEKWLAKLRASLAAQIQRYLASAAREEQIHDFAILNRSFSIERGELTPKLSLCRATIARNFAAELATLDAAAKAAKSAENRPKS